LLLGTAAGYGGFYYSKALGQSIRSSAFLLSSIPFLVLLYWCHYPLQEILNIVVDPFITAAVLLSIVNTVGVADIILKSLLSFPSQYLEVAKISGLRPTTIRSKIIFPLLLRTSLPPILMLQIQVLQMTLFASLISVNEVFREAQRINSMIYRPIEIYTTMALLFIAICAPVNFAAKMLRDKYIFDLSEK
jgi:polar amino acid transport system permease protein